MDWRPLGDRVIVTPVAAEEQTASGIVLPDVAREKPQVGTVRAVGPDVEGIELGGRVLYSKYGGTELRIDEEDVLVLRIGDVLAAKT